ncbi:MULTISPECIES: hypothetical protein [Pseudomonas]|uniref:hypothetical protein n=1 Tax=Pseudomonas TaxID=286 RepID=UPI000BA1CE5C|nr:hypothetical protein [Pseudomonas fragi]OZY61915.1 hypothetical protein CJF37_21465 [Pseudomonas fragi]
MQQGSAVTTHQSHPPSTQASQLAVQRSRCVALKEVSSLAQSMHLMALYCIDQGHVTVDHMEALANTLGMLRRHVDALDIELASN